MKNPTANNKRGLALVTGAMGGIGKVISQELVSEGWDVALNDLGHENSGKQWCEQLNQGESHAALFLADIGDSDAVSGMFDKIENTFGRSPSLLVNNAAVQTWQPLLDIDPADWERIIRTNLSGTFFNTQCFARHCVRDQRGGVIVNIGSGCNHLAFPSLVAYNAAKGGIEMLTKSSALELGRYGIRINCIAPGAIETERTRQETAEFASAWSPLTPLGRIGSPQDIADAVVLLSGDKAGFISGQTINVDGGLFAQAIWPEKY